MKISSRIKQVLSITLVSVLAATVMPSAVSAEEEYYDYEDVVTVEVDLGDGGGGPIGCEGISTLELPDNTLRARSDSIQPGISDPNIIDYLFWLEGSNSSYSFLDNEPTEFNDDDLDSYVQELSNASLTPVLNDSNGPNTDATVDTLASITYDTSTSLGYVDEDTNEDGIIDVTDAPDYLSETRGVYASDVFVVEYDANDCIDSDEVGVLYTSRGFVERLANEDLATWESAEADWETSTSSVNRGTAYLRGNVSLLGGLISIPAKIATDPVVTDEPVGSYVDIFDYWDPISLGDAAEVEMRAVMKIFGSNASGKYRTQFYFQLLTGEENYIGCQILNNCY
jgi:hypothetical protein